VKQCPGSLLLQKYPYCASTMHTVCIGKLAATTTNLYRRIHIYKVYCDWFPMDLNDYISHIPTPRSPYDRLCRFLVWAPPTTILTCKFVFLPGVIEALSRDAPMNFHAPGGSFYGIMRVYGINQSYHSSSFFVTTHGNCSTTLLPRG
jgi:hypothetical protein